MMSQNRPEMNLKFGRPIADFKVIVKELEFLGSLVTREDGKALFLGFLPTNPGTSDQDRRATPLEPSATCL